MCQLLTKNTTYCDLYLQYIDPTSNCWKLWVIKLLWFCENCLKAFVASVQIITLNANIFVVFLLSKIGVYKFTSDLDKDYL